VSLALQIVVTGLAAGGVYGVVAIAYTLIYRLTGVVHFALGELIALAVFVTVHVAAGAGPVTQTSVGGGRFAPARVVGRLFLLWWALGTESAGLPVHVALCCNVYARPLAGVRPRDERASAIATTSGASASLGAP